MINSLSAPLLGFPGSSAVKNLPAVEGPQETGVQSLGQDHALEDGMANHWQPTGNPLQYSCLGNPMDRVELNMTEAI